MTETAKPGADPNLITAKEVAETLRISVSTLYRALRYGPSQSRSGGIALDLRDIPFKWIGGRKFFSRSGLTELLVKNM